MRDEDSVKARCETSKTEVISPESAIQKRVKVEIDWMLDDGILDPVEESEWISPMVVQDKKTGEV